MPNTFLDSVVSTWARIYRVQLNERQYGALIDTLTRFDRGQIVRAQTIVVAVQALRGAMARRDGGYWLPAVEVEALDRELASVPQDALQQHERDQAVIERALRLYDAIRDPKWKPAQLFTSNAWQDFLEAVQRHRGEAHDGSEQP